MLSFPPVLASLYGIIWGHYMFSCYLNRHMHATMQTLKAAGIQPWKNNVVFCCCTDFGAKSYRAAFVP